ncbi:GMC family oxidoreductase [Phyllobacterium sp. SB3]|uniref:GMC family oxidoreductase n=1 Tax=Phyllobacterium sp. SB3 TaxID=3156073 RepID=UPI0032AEA966
MHDSLTLSEKVFDVIVCGSGTSGSVVARRLSDDPDIHVLLLEAGAMQYSDALRDAGRWPEALGGPEDWAFPSEPDRGLNGRSLTMSMGKTVGGSSSINAMIWARGHQRDWDYFADEAGDSAWGYQAISDVYGMVEDYKGISDMPRGKGGLVTVWQPRNPHPVAKALVESAATLGIPSFVNPNGQMMTAKNGCAISDVRANGQQRMTIFDSYLRPILTRKNLSIVTGAEVQRLIMDGSRAVGVQVVVDGEQRTFKASLQIVLSTGAINTPGILMHSGIGRAEDLKRLGIPVVQDLPGVGENLQDHICFPTIWEFDHPMPAQGNGSEATLYITSDANRVSPDILMCQAEFPVCSPEIAQKGIPEHGWSLVAGLAQPKSRGRVRLRSANPGDPVAIHLNALSDPDDLDIARTAVELSRDIGAAYPLRDLNKRECYPGRTYGADLDLFLKESAVPFWHQTCTAKMGRDAMSVVDNNLKVYGIENLTIADGSVLPRITSGNTMAPCVIIGERASHILRQQFYDAPAVQFKG